MSYRGIGLAVLSGGGGVLLLAAALFLPDSLRTMGLPETLMLSGVLGLVFAVMIPRLMAPREQEWSAGFAARRRKARLPRVER